jgi:hypothetical protein
MAKAAEGTNNKKAYGLAHMIWPGIPGFKDHFYYRLYCPVITMLLKGLTGLCFSICVAGYA